MSQEALGLELGVTKATVSNWENDRDNPSFQYLKQMPEKLGVSIEALLPGASTEPLVAPPLFVSERLDELPPLAGLTYDELALLRAFRAMGSQRREALLQLLNAR